MIGKLLSSEETNAALVVALSATVVVLVAKGSGPLSPGRLLSGVLSDPIAGREPRVEHLPRAPVSRPEKGEETMTINVIDFAVAHHTENLRNLRGAATQGQPLADFLET
ncbi:MAG TPA: hypothetical protein VFI90_04580 [Rubrobacter sp.]|nr:hypothetical protein [Rubrobacter sp.]